MDKFALVKLPGLLLISNITQMHKTSHQTKGSNVMLSQNHRSNTKNTREGALMLFPCIHLHLLLLPSRSRSHIAAHPRHPRRQPLLFPLQ